MKSEELQQDVLGALIGLQQEGNTWATFTHIHETVSALVPGVNPIALMMALVQLCKMEKVQMEEDLFALDITATCEKEVASWVVSAWSVPEGVVELPVGPIAEHLLTDEQLDAIRKAGLNPMTLVCGGHGTGKTTTAIAMAKAFQVDDKGVILTGASDRSIANFKQGGYETPKALSQVLMQPKSHWDNVHMVIVDDAELLTTEQLFLLFQNHPKGCNIVLIGSEAAPFYYGAGNTMGDLLDFQLVRTYLTEVFRPEEVDSALAHNLQNYQKMKQPEDFRYDGTFQFHEANTHEDVVQKVCKDAASQFIAGEDAIVLCDNPEIAEIINQKMQASKGHGFPMKGSTFYQGDCIRVNYANPVEEIFKNDTGHICFPDPNRSLAVLQLSGDHLHICNEDDWDASKIALAYALSTEQAYGNEYDYVYIVLDKDNPFQTRHTLETAFSRSKKEVHIYGTKENFQKAMKRFLFPPITRMAEELQADCEAYFNPDLNGLF